jgi:hypothetical protein
MAAQHTTATNDISVFEKREELHRVLQSQYFANAPKKRRFLEFVAEQTLLGNADKLNEYLIGVEVYGRGTDFNPQQDPIVRVQAHEIRRALKKYYEEQGKTSAWQIDLPAGHYVPVFSRADHEEDAAKGPQRTAAPARSRTFAVLLSLVLILAGVCVLLTVLLVREHSQAVRTSESFSVPKLPQELEWFWGPFLPPAPPPIIVIPNHPLLRAAHGGDSAQTLAHTYEIAKDSLPEFRDTIHFRELKRFLFVPSTTDFTAVGETLGLWNFFELFSRAGQKVRLQQSRLVTFDEFKQGNAILLGGNQAWSGRVFLNPEGFLFQGGVILNKSPRPGEQPLYKPQFDPVTNQLTRDYALILMLPNEKEENRILLVYGIYTQGSQAAIEYITSAERLPELRKALIALSPDRKTPPRYFQVLLETSVENSVPGKSSLVAVRAVSN